MIFLIDLFTTLFRIACLVGGLVVVAGTFLSAVNTLVLPRSSRDPMARFVFLKIRKLFELRCSMVQTFEGRDRILAFYAPIALLLLLIFWLFAIEIGFTLLFYGVGVSGGWYGAFTASGSSLLTLGFVPADNLAMMVLSFVEATIGLVFVALLIAYLPTIYSAFSQREAVVTMLEVRAGSPPSAVTMLERFNRLRSLDAELNNEWMTWERWFVEIDENHTSLAMMIFFRSPHPDRSWVTAAGAIMDSAALLLSAIDVPFNARAALALRAGYIAMRHIADLFLIEYDPEPQPGDPISITRQEFEEALDELVEAGIPIKADRDQAWLDFAGWRVNYDIVLLRLAALTMAPYAPWSSDRSVAGMGATTINMRTDASAEPESQLDLDDIRSNEALQEAMDNAPEELTMSG